MKLFFYGSLLFLLIFSMPAHAGMMAKNDFRFGSGGFKQDSISLFFPAAYKLLAGIEGTFYKSNDLEKIHSARLPLVYTGETNLAEFSPFIYSHRAGQSAYGGKLMLKTTFTNPKNENFFHLSITGAHAFIKGNRTDEGLTDFQQTAIELKAEKNFYRQFCFTISAAGFLKPTKGTNNLNLQSSILDQKDLIDFNGYGMLTVLPEWIASVTVSRNFQPEFNSEVYAGYSKISIRNFEPANSYSAGMKFFLDPESESDPTLDFGYNYFKYHETTAKQYFRILISTMF